MRAIPVLPKVSRLNSDPIKRSRLYLILLFCMYIVIINIGVVLGGVTLGTVISQKRPEFIEDLRPNVPHLVKLMRTLLQTTHAPDHDVQGVTDPFLQVRFYALAKLNGMTFQIIARPIDY